MSAPSSVHVDTGEIAKDETRRYRARCSCGWYGDNPDNPPAERAVVHHCADRIRAAIAPLETP